MKTRRTIEEEVNFEDSVILEKVNVNGQDYFLRVNNSEGVLSFSFYEKKPGKDEIPDYSIIIDKNVSSKTVEIIRIFFCFSDICIIVSCFS